MSEDKLRSDLIKAWIAIDSDTCPNGFYSADYLKEKIELILEGYMEWHYRINESCEDIEKTYDYIKRRRRKKHDIFYTKSTAPY